MSIGDEMIDTILIFLLGLLMITPILIRIPDGNKFVGAKIIFCILCVLLVSAFIGKILNLY